MPKVIRKDVDNSKGIDCPPTVPSGGSPDVFTNSHAQVRVGDAYVPHYRHGRAASEGSPNVFVNSKAIHRNGDGIDCGDAADNGSPDVFANS